MEESDSVALRVLQRDWILLRGVAQPTVQALIELFDTWRAEELKEVWGSLGAGVLELEGGDVAVGRDDPRSHALADLVARGALGVWCRGRLGRVPRVELGLQGCVELSTHACVAGLRFA